MPESGASVPALPLAGGSTAYLARLKDGRKPPLVDWREELAIPRCETLQQFREENAGDQALLGQLNNKVKVCPNCGKGCAFTLADCNSCGTSLKDTGITHTDNVFMGFVYGVGKGNFPYKISVRKQTPEFLCFDDPLSLSPAHLNAIPTSIYCPDLRHLFLDPDKGLDLASKLLRMGTEAAVETFWKDARFVETYFNNEPPPANADEMSKIVFAGCNFPPSMNQLHLQFILPPMMPMHFSMAIEEMHFSHKRFFPLEYLLSALKLGRKAQLRVTDDTSIDEVIGHFDKLGVNYDDYHARFMRRVKATQKKYAKWKSDDFDLFVVNGGGAHPTCGDVSKDEAARVDPKAVQKEDEKRLQNYGRPHVDGRPSGTYYKFAKRPGEVAVFSAPPPGALRRLSVLARGVCCR